jgi:hypothetical protein
MTRPNEMQTGGHNSYDAVAHVGLLLAVGRS